MPLHDLSYAQRRASLQLANQARSEKAEIRLRLARGLAPIREGLTSPHLRRERIDQVVRLCLTYRQAKLDTRRTPSPHAQGYNARRLIISAGVDPDLVLWRASPARIDAVVAAVEASPLYAVTIRAERELAPA